jgi:heme-degrading monooxygenase HmoA
MKPLPPCNRSGKVEIINAVPHNTKHPMILEVALLEVLPERTQEFEASFLQAQEIISSMKGYLGHELQKSLESPNRYLLLVRWESLEDHTLGFRQSAEYQEWKKLLHHFYDPFPQVDHYRKIAGEKL